MLTKHVVVLHENGQIITTSELNLLNYAKRFLNLYNTIFLYLRINGAKKI